MLQEGLPDGTSLVRLAYLDKPPTVTINQANRVRSTTRKILSQKQYSWAYEREWRVLAHTKGRVSYEPEEPLREVYLGSRITEAQRDLLLTAIADMDVKVYMMGLDGYEPVWESVAVRRPKKNKP